MENKKMTKKDYFNEIKTLVEESTNELKDELIYFVESQIASIDSKAEKAKERAAAKKAEGDALRESVKSVLTDEFQTADEILSQLDGEDLTVAKVRARLTQLVKLGEAEKTDVKNAEGKVRKAYKLV